MDYRQLGASGLMVPALSFGTATFYPTGTSGRTGSIDETGARRMVDLCLDHGVTLFDTATSYGEGKAEDVLGSAIKGRRDQVLLSTKAGMPAGPGPNELGLSRHNLTVSIERSLSRLGTDYIDIFQLHTFDALTPVEESLSTLDRFVRAGKIRYIGVSNFSGWQLMKSLAVAERHLYPRYVVQQVYYSLVGRDFEHDLMPLGLDQGIGAAVWSPLGWGRLTGNVRRGSPLPAESRLHTTWDLGPPVDNDSLFRVVDELDAIAAETGRLVPQVALNWLLQRPTVSTIIIGARTEAQLRDNLGAIGWTLTADQIERLEAASPLYPLYPQWHQQDFVAERSRDRSAEYAPNGRPIPFRTPVQTP